MWVEPMSDGTVRGFLNTCFNTSLGIEIETGTETRPSPSCLFHGEPFPSTAMADCFGGRHHSIPSVSEMSCEGMSCINLSRSIVSSAAEAGTFAGTFAVQAAARAVPSVALMQEQEDMDASISISISAPAILPLAAALHRPNVASPSPSPPFQYSFS